MRLINTNIPELVLLEPQVFGDNRGFFMESYNQDTLKNLGLDYNFVQDNHSLSKAAGTLRGLHFQKNPKAQTKLVRVSRGAIFDVAVDLRKGSPTYGHWESVILTEENKRQFLVPKGFAHGFCTLVENTEVQYKVDEFYSPEHDSGIAWNDSNIGINWPIYNPTLSEKDEKHPFLRNSNHAFEY